jgi:hypothetical protein
MTELTSYVVHYENVAKLGEKKAVWHAIGEMIHNSKIDFRKLIESNTVTFKVTDMDCGSIRIVMSCQYEGEK